MPDYTITKIGTNNADLVKTFKALLNATNLNPKAQLTIDEKMTTAAWNQARQISTLYKLNDKAEFVSTRTLVYLAKNYGQNLPNPAARNFTVPAWLNKFLTLCLSNAKTSVNVEVFLQMYRENFKEYLPANGGWEDNFRRFVGFVQNDATVTDRRWAAYIFATAMHEGRSAANQWKATWNPVSETGGAGMSYGSLETVVDWDGKPLDAQNIPLPEITDPTQIAKMGRALVNLSRRGKNHYYPQAQILQRRYYGRGYVQITHQDNYRAMDEALNLNGKLHIEPELAATDAQVSYNISSYGIINGSFMGGGRRHVAGQGFIGGHKIADYVNDTSADYFNAREIVNGDKSKVEKGNTKSNGQLVAGYCENFQAMLEAA